MSDYTDIVVGAGSAGAPLAARLSEDSSRRVLLLEAGPDYGSLDETPADLRVGTYPSFTDHDWGFTAMVTPTRQIGLPRGKVTGGSSAVNTGIALRGDPRDFESWVAEGNDEWSWDAVLPFYIKLEDDRDLDGILHGKRGPIPIHRWRPDELVPLQQAMLEVCESLGHPLVDDHNRPGTAGVGPIPNNTPGKIRHSTAVGYLTPETRRRPNLTIRPQSLVDRVLFDGKRAVGVALHTGNGPEVVRGDNVVLSAGSVGSPAILWRSGIGPAARLQAIGVQPLIDAPGVGANLSDHPIVGVSLVPKPGVCDMRNPVCQVILKYTAPGSEEFNDMQLYMFSQLDITTFAKEVQEAVQGSMVFMVPASLQIPRSRGQVTLTSADPTAAPTVELNSGDQAEDRRRLMDGVRLAWTVANAPQVRQYADRIVFLDQRTVDSDEALSAFVSAGLNTTHHPCGTVKFGPESDPMAVLDQHCRVRGVDNLRVADASIMPAIVRSNPNLTCIMFGERLADWMRQGG